MMNEEHGHQIQQEQERDFMRAETELKNLLSRMEKRSFSIGDKVLRDDVNETRDLLKMLGVNI